MNDNPGFESICAEVARELATVLASTGQDCADALLRKIKAADKVYLAAAGRSGLMIQAFAMRLMHLGFLVHVVGDVTTPAITEKDLLLIASGSGETAGLCSMADKAKTIGCQVALITTRAESTIGKLVDLSIVMQTSTPKATEGKPTASIQPGANCFEQSLLLWLDSLILYYMKCEAIDFSVIMRRHANLE